MACIQVPFISKSSVIVGTNIVQEFFVTIILVICMKGKKPLMEKEERYTTRTETMLLFRIVNINGTIKIENRAEKRNQSWVEEKTLRCS